MKSLSVIVCTRNRADLLNKTLKSLQACAVPEGWETEFIVVDNGSTDHTYSVVEAASTSLRPFRYVREARAGLSCARNAGIRASSGEVIAFTDDDCLVSESWLTMLSQSAAEHPEADGWFGQVRAVENVSEAHLVAHKVSTQSQVYAYPQSPINIGHGNNMSLRRSVFQSLGLFDETLGAGGPLRSAEDLDMAYRVLRDGGKLLYDPQCVVFHKPRETAEQVRATHWRNAIGMGACFGKHLLRGDLFALKNIYWMWSGTLKSFFKKRNDGAGESNSTRWAYLAGLPYGALKRVVLGFRYQADGWEVPLQ